ncbi:hypothetical protein [Aliagarivorans taiwanensis]|uniref:hypothetical protein n=1 Tax=Aliagarivorans taiwanensis TaxID=561966 RepID=UPI00041A1B21|nr:hypothetical protein [Aliagarivorans taiwanensis]
MDTNILVVIGISSVAVLLTYVLTKKSADKKAGKYKTLDEALIKANDEYDSVKSSFESAKRELEKVNIETYELQKLVGTEEALQNSIAGHEKKLDSINKLLAETNEKLESGESNLEELMGDIDLYSRLDEYIAHGHYALTNPHIISR